MHQTATRQVPYKSKSSDKTYYVVVAADGRPISCGCPGWINSKAPKTCTHIKQELAKNPTGEAAAPPVPTATVPAPPPGRRVFPMLASAMTKGQRLDDFIGHPGWALEEKLDGHRLMVRVGPAEPLDPADEGTRNRAIDAWARPRAGGTGPNSRQLPGHILEALSRLPAGVYDGELRIPGGKSWDVTRTDLTEKLELVLFDVVECMGVSCLGEPYDRRRQYLEMALAHLARTDLFDELGLDRPVRMVPNATVSIDAVEDIWARGGEGAILKNRTSTYRPGHRSDAWLKVKKGGTVKLRIVGFQDGKRGPCSVTDVEGTLDGQPLKTCVTTGAGNLDIIRQVEKNPAAWIGRSLVVSFAETIKADETITRRKPGESALQLRHGIWDHLAGDGE